MEAFLKALPTVATSQLAYVAYILTLVAWVVIAWRVRRYQYLLKNLRALPSKDRLAAIKAEMGNPLSAQTRSSLTNFPRHICVTFTSSGDALEDYLKCKNQ
jgi:hypothetical protein